MGQTTHAVICDRCDVIDANLNDREPVNLENYRADLHVCVSRERKRHQVRVQQTKKIKEYLICRHSYVKPFPQMNLLFASLQVSSQHQNLQVQMKFTVLPYQRSFVTFEL